MSATAVAEAPPTTLHRVIQATIAEGLKARYEAPQQMSHQLFVLMMQLNDRHRGASKQATRSGSPGNVVKGFREKAAADEIR